jgi:hypothetical protein
MTRVHRFRNQLFHVYLCERPRCFGVLDYLYAAMWGCRECGKIHSKTP